MNIILQLLDPDFVKGLFKKELLPVCPEITEIKEIKIEPVKKHVWRTTYHVVFRFITTLADQNGAELTWQIYCSAHSSEPRENVHEALKFLWGQSFSQNDLTVPRPLFYSPAFRAVFYQGVEGKLMYAAMKERNYSEIEIALTKTAAWFAKLHALPTAEAKNFNPQNSRIATVVPGKDHILEKISALYPEHLKAYEKFYHLFVLREESFLGSSERHWYAHGDAHPENIIILPNHKLAMIDFADFCLSDFARDLGTFLQQLEYMANRRIGEHGYTEKIKKLFLSSYLDFAKIKLDESLEARIANYYNWTAIRTANYFLFKHDPQPESARPLIELVCRNLNIKK